MGWQDAPAVNQNKWSQAPTVGTAPVTSSAWSEAPATRPPPLSSTQHQTGDLIATASSGLDDFLRPFKRTGEIYGQEVSEGLRLMQDEGFLNKAMGALRYGLAALEAPMRGVLGEPVGDVATKTAVEMGADPEMAQTGGQFLEDTLTIGGQIAGPGTWFKALFKDAGQVYGALKYFVDDASRGSKVQKLEPGSYKPLYEESQADRLIREATERADEVEKGARDWKTFGHPEWTAVDETTKGRVPRISLSTQDDVILGVEKAVKENYNNSERLYKQVSRALIDGLDNNQVGLDDVFPLLDKYGVTPEAFAREFAVTASESGRTLQKLSALMKRINRQDLPPELQAQLDDIAKHLDEKQTIPGQIFEGLGKVENFRRATLVTQVATTMRNIISQTGRLTVGMVDDMLTAALRGDSMKVSMRDALDAASAHLKALPGIRDKKLLKDIFEGNPITEAALMNKSVHEIEAVNKVLKGLNYLNTGQEKFFRKLAFEARLRENIKRTMGKNLEDIDPTKIPGTLLRDAVDYALEMSFAAEAKSKGARNLISAWSKLPFMTTINPFPRFAFANALPFMLSHSPLGFAKALSPKSMRALASGNPEEFARAASRAMIGTGFMGTAMEIRSGGLGPIKPGEKWYELQIGDKTIDTRTLAPFSSYLLMAEAMLNPDNLQAADWTSAAVGLNRVSGTGLVLVDAIRAKDPTLSGEAVKKWLAQYISSFTVPMRTVKDFYSAIDPEAAIYRDTRGESIGEEVLHSTLTNIPEADQLMAGARSPLREGDLITEPVNVFGLEVPGPVFRQLTGLTLKRKNRVEKEVDKLGFDGRTYRPKTGVKEADRRVSEVMAKTVTTVLPTTVINRLWYQKLTKAQKRLVLSELFKEIKAQSRDYVVSGRDPEVDPATGKRKGERDLILASMMKAARTPKLESAVIEEATGINLRDPKEVERLVKEMILKGKNK